MNVRHCAKPCETLASILPSKALMSQSRSFHFYFLKNHPFFFFQKKKKKNHIQKTLHHRSRNFIKLIKNISRPSRDHVFHSTLTTRSRVITSRNRHLQSSIQAKKKHKTINHPSIYSTLEKLSRSTSARAFMLCHHFRPWDPCAAHNHHIIDLPSLCLDSKSNHHHHIFCRLIY